MICGLNRVLEYKVSNEFNAARVDAYLSAVSDELSRSRAAALAQSGAVFINGKTANKKDKVYENDCVSVNVPEPVEYDVLAQDIKLDIVYEDDSLIVINKPQNMVVHPAPGNYSGTLVNALMSHCRGNLSGINGVLRPGIVHRIDNDTSGLIIVAKNDDAHRFLAEQLKDRSLSRIYYALVNGNIKQDSATINQPIGRNEKDRKKMCVTNKNSREAVTDFTVLKRYGKYTLVKCKLHTGRTHQIRVHMAYIGHSVVGDKTYGIKKEEFKLNGQLLHAKQISFIHPATKKQMSFEVDLPDYFKEVLDKLKPMEQ